MEEELRVLVSMNQWKELTRLVEAGISLLHEYADVPKTYLTTPSLHGAITEVTSLSRMLDQQLKRENISTL